MRDVLTVILAGGRGSRLEPLTRDRAKPAVPFGGAYRIIDFALSNCLNSGLRRVLVMTQYKARSLDRHVRAAWNFLSPEMGESVEILPPQMRVAETWYTGTANAIYQNIYSLERENPALVLILAGDHIYKMDYHPMIEAHRRSGADLTVGSIPIPMAETDQFGIMETDDNHRVTAFLEKPKTAAPMPGSTTHCLGSMGIYVFNLRALFEYVVEDAADPRSNHDFGKDIIPAMIRRAKVSAFPFQDRNTNQKEAYWRDVGTLDAFHQANMDLVAISPVLNLYDTTWPIRTFHGQNPPPKFVFNSEGVAGVARRGEAIDSLVCNGCIISGGHVHMSVLSPNVRVNSYAVIDQSILFEGVSVGRHCRLSKVIIDKEVTVPANTTIGFDADHDRRRGFTISEEGVTVVAKGTPPAAFEAK